MPFEAALAGRRFENRQAEQRLLWGIEHRVVVNRSVLAVEPVRVGHHIGCVAQSTANLILERFGAPVGVRQDAVVEQEQAAAPDQREHEQGKPDTIKADAAGAHHRQFARAREAANRGQHRDERGHRRHVHDELRRRVVEVLEEHRGRGFALEEAL